LPQPKPGKDKTGSGGQGTPQAGKGKPDPAGEVRDAPTGPDTDGTPAPTEGEWKQKTAEALQAAKMAGTLPAGMARKVEDALGTRIDTRSLLLRFMTERTKADYAWTRPNPRYIAQGIYLPALESVSMGEVAIMVDTSGSVDSQSLAYARAIVEDVISECSPAAVSVWYSDAKVCKVDRFERGESLTWEPAGGGGTDFRPALKAIEEEGTAVCVLCITDLWGTFPDFCDLPVLWLSTTDKIAPFGETIPLPQ
jgi:predicted metal-dependent peptidase